MVDISPRLNDRLGRVHARQRLGIEEDHEAQVFGQGLNFFHLENWYSIHALIRYGLRFMGLYGRGYRNAACVQLRVHNIVSSRLPPGFDGFQILHLSDLHVDM
ncbi:MAG: metallophosphoesterase, partial [Mesorhizobium sp.]